MTAPRLMIGLALAATATGCANLAGGQDAQRLNSRVNLLEERVTQLERMGNWPPSATSPEAPMEDALVPAAPAPEPAAAPKKQADKTALKTASIVDASAKPSTKQIQQALKNAGFYQGSVDGKSGPMTKDAVREFQRVHGLKDDGVVGKQTWTKLSAYGDSAGAAGETVK